MSRGRKASGVVSLFDPQGGRPNLGMEEAAVQRPLFVIVSLVPFNTSDEGGCVFRTLRTPTRSRRSMPS